MTWNSWACKICPNSYSTDISGDINLGTQVSGTPLEAYAYVVMVLKYYKKSKEVDISKCHCGQCMFTFLLASQACSRDPHLLTWNNQRTVLSSIWHKSCRSQSHPDSSLGKCHLLFHWIILCSLQNKPCDLSLFLLKQTKIATLFYPTARDTLAASQHCGSTSPGSKMSWDGPCELFLAPKAQLSRFLMDRGIQRRPAHNRVNYLTNTFFSLKTLFFVTVQHRAKSFT